MSDCVDIALSQTKLDEIISDILDEILPAQAAKVSISLQKQNRDHNGSEEILNVSVPYNIGIQELKSFVRVRYASTYLQLTAPLFFQCEQRPLRDDRTLDSCGVRNGDIIAWCWDVWRDNINNVNGSNDKLAVMTIAGTETESNTAVRLTLCELGSKSNVFILECHCYTTLKKVRKAIETHEYTYGVGEIELRCQRLQTNQRLGSNKSSLRTNGIRSGDTLEWHWTQRKSAHLCQEIIVKPQQSDTGFTVTVGEDTKCNVLQEAVRAWLRKTGNAAVKSSDVYQFVTDNGTKLNKKTRLSKCVSNGDTIWWHARTRQRRRSTPLFFDHLRFRNARFVKTYRRRSL